MTLTRGKLIKISLITIFIAVWAYRSFLYIDIAHGCYVKILPSLTEWSAPKTIKSALKILERTVPDEYERTCTRVRTINPNVSCGSFEGGCFINSKSTARSIDISTSQRSLAWTAAVIVHETCHAWQAYEDRPFSEFECNTNGDRVLNTIVEI